LRKEIEYEKEQFKSVIKEADELEIMKNKIINRIDKISMEIYELPSTNRKLIGTDGLGNEYYFYPYNISNNKLYVKKYLNFDSRGATAAVKNKFEWRELTRESEIKDLLSKLSEKGVREKNLLAKLNKIYPKRLKVISEKNAVINKNKDANLNNQMVIDIENLDDTENKNCPLNSQNIINSENEEEKEKSEILKSSLEWKNLNLEKFEFL
jgi:hypothetical protein